jgi:Ca2+-binding RTX toxin-like protein
MAIFTLTVDTNANFDTSLFFAANLAVRYTSRGYNNTAGTAYSTFKLIKNGIVDDSSTYSHNFTGKANSFGFAPGDAGVFGTITSAKLSSSTDGVNFTQLAHLDIALGSNTGMIGGIDMATSFCTPELLMGQPARIDTNGATLVIKSNVGDDTLNGSNFSDQIFASGGDDICNGFDAADTISGGAGRDTITGGNGDDKLNGGGENDVISGGGGADVLRGILGNDRLTGGAGGDKFVFNSTLNPATNFDTITDFGGADLILLEDKIFTAVGAALGAGEVRNGAAAADANDYIIYNPANGVLYYDADGNGSIQQVRFAKVAEGLLLTNADFVII